MNQSLWNECVRFHGHACPGLALGYRATEIGMAELGIPIERATDEELVCVAENDTCGVDCVQCMISCTIGKGNMIMRPSGKMAFTFFNRNTEKSVRVVAKRLDRSVDRAKIIERILNDSVESVFEIKVPTYEIPDEARLFESVQCDVCKEYCREDKIRLVKGKHHCSDCYNPYDRG
jgi:Formylmethanofuran dehydrogenase subunit E